MKGVKLFAIDPLTQEDSDNYLGLQILETSISKARLDTFTSWGDNQSQVFTGCRVWGKMP